MPLVSIIALLFVFTRLSLAQWDESRLAALARDVADEHLLSCFVVVHTGDPDVLDDVSRLVKVLHVGKSLRSVRTLTFNEYFVAKGCQTNLILILAWLPGAKSLFSKFTEKPVLGNPLWLIALPKDVSAAEFIADDFLPFKPHVLTVSATDEGAILRETWRVTWGYALHVRPYATWTSSGLSCQRKHCTFEARDDLEGYPLRAATKEDMPISGPVKIDGKDALAGFFGLVFYDLAQQLNCTTVVLPPAKMTGSAKEGVWNGLIGMLQRNESDTAVGPNSIQANSISVAGFLKPLLRSNYQVFFKQDGTVVEWGAFLKPFGPFVWHLILMWFIVGGLTLNYIYHVGVQYGQEKRTFLWEFSKVNSFLTFLRAFCGQGSHYMPDSLSCRGLYLTGYLTSSILVTAYSAALISKLTLQDPVRPFDSLESFLKVGTHQLTAINASTDYTYFSEANDTTLMKIYQNQMKKIAANDLPTGKEEGLRHVCEKKKTALFITFAVTKLAAKEMENTNRKCRILYFRNPLGTVFLTIAIRKHFPFEEIFNYRLQLMAERGILNRLQKLEWGLTESNAEVTTPEVEIQQVAQIHGVLLAGMILSLLILYAEHMSVFYRYGRLLLWWRLHGVDSDVIVTVIFSVVAISLLIGVIVHFA